MVLSFGVTIFLWLILQMRTPQIFIISWIIIITLTMTVHQLGVEKYVRGPLPAEQSGHAAACLRP